MNLRSGIFALHLLLTATPLFAADPSPAESRCYELRIYDANEGKLDGTHDMLRAAAPLFVKHGMTIVGFWTPLENPDRRVYYLLSYPSRAARETAWTAFRADPDWKKAKKEVEKDGAVLKKHEAHFLHATDFSPPIKPEANSPPRVFELRTYTASPGNLDKLEARFRDPTTKLFAKHGMGQFGYWLFDNDQPETGNTLIYLLDHKSKAASEVSFKNFRDDPLWKSAKEASEKDAGGPLTTPDGVKSVMLVPTEYSPSR